MSDWEVIHSKDCHDKAPLEYAEGKEWIKEALTISGPWESEIVSALDSLKVPEKGPQKLASRKVGTQVVEIWMVSKEDGKRHNKWQMSSPSVYRLIYEEKHSAKTFLSLLRKNLACTWVHVPATNVSKHPNGSGVAL